MGEGRRFSSLCPAFSLRLPHFAEHTTQRLATPPPSPLPTFHDVPLPPIVTSPAPLRSLRRPAFVAPSFPACVFVRCFQRKSRAELLEEAS